MPNSLAVLMSRWRPVYGEIEFECGHWAVFENAIDMAHIHYLHADSFGNKV
jgi:phenylpropionate dioxygenase-like ring-hydroxylating dioxygenase large terminal subunit